MTVSEEKRALRRAVEAELATLSGDQLAQASGALVKLLASWVGPQGFATVLATLPLAGEPDLTPFLQSWLGYGEVALAKTGPGRTLEFRKVESLEGPWDVRPYGLREPLASAPHWVPGGPTLALVPGLAFAPAPGGGAFRLGRGAGYYDRWLTRFRGQLFSLGVGLGLQIRDRLPTEDHDQTLDGWLDPSGFHGMDRETRPGD